jgi:hypothetical protein
VAEARTKDDGFYGLLPEQTGADFQGFSLVFNDDDIQLVFSGVDEAVMPAFIRVRSMGQEKGFKGRFFPPE